MCPDDDTIVEMLEGRLDDGARAAVLGHLDACEACRRLIADAGAFGDGDPDGDAEPPDDQLGRGSAIGRYVVTGVLGAGAMGVVYAAHDPQLGRDVAIKRLRAEALGDRTAEQARDLTLREARTVAQLAHPNVVTVYDADVDDGRVFIVMELVAGQTVRAWLGQRPRRWRELRDVFVQAGRGLEAAHAAGVVHRDVKPDNLLVGDDGRVRVTDFGLARWVAPPPGRPPLGRAALRSSTSMAGTPAYMSPEQLAGLAIDARSDLFAFCVALYEAIYGARPFDGRRFEAPGPVAAPLPPVIAPPHPGVPARARRALERGLRADRDRRPPTMAALLAELDHRPRLTAPRIGFAAVALAAIAAGVIAVRPAPAAPTCTGAAAAWGSLWDDAQRASLRAAFRRTGRAIADESFAQTDAAMNDFRRRWLALHTDACRANRRGEQSAGVLDRRMGCLASRRREVEGVIASLFADVGSWDNVLGDAAGLVRRLAPPDDCADPRGDDVASTQLRPVRAPIARVVGDGRLTVFAIGAGGQPWAIEQRGDADHRGWGSWAPLGDRLEARGLVAAADAGGALDVIAVDGGGAIRGVAQRAGSWRDARWTRLGAGEQVAIADDGERRHQLFAIERGALRHLGQVAPNSGWGEWQPIHDGVAQVVAIADRGQVRAFFVAGDRAWQAAQDAGGGWVATSLGDRAVRQLDAAVDHDGRIELVAIDPTGRALHRWLTGAWEPLGTPEELATIHLTRLGDDEHLDAFGVTPSGRLVNLWQAGAPLRWNLWWETVELDPTMKRVDEVALVEDGAHRWYFFAAAADGALWMKWLGTTGVHGWLVL